jgi:hypothetical protein
MTSVRPGAPGATRICPHCRAAILESATVCPGCRHHLRFDPSAAARAVPNLSPLKVEGTIKHPEGGEPWEYCVVLSIKNARGEEITRQVVGVGALHASDQRTFTLAVEMFTPADAKPPSRGGPGR